MDDPFNPDSFDAAPGFGTGDDPFNPAPPQLDPPQDPFSSAGMFGGEGTDNFAAVPGFGADAPAPVADVFAGPEGDDPFGFDAPPAPSASDSGPDAPVAPVTAPSAEENSLVAPPKGKWLD